MTDREILEAAKEEVGQEAGYCAFREIEPDLTEEYLYRAALLALQKQREQIKTELREKIEAHREMASKLEEQFRAENNFVKSLMQSEWRGYKSACVVILELLKTL